MFKKCTNKMSIETRNHQKPKNDNRGKNKGLSMWKFHFEKHSFHTYAEMFIQTTYEMLQTLQET